jgi:hypothetical protein
MTFGLCNAPTSLLAWVLCFSLTLELLCARSIYWLCSNSYLWLQEVLSF